MLGFDGFDWPFPPGTELWTVALWGHPVTGSLMGQGSDSSGLPMVGAKITVRSTQTSQSAGAVAHSPGDYLLPGAYNGDGAFALAVRFSNTGAFMPAGMFMILSIVAPAVFGPAACG